MFDITDGRASGCAWKPARVSGGAMTPTLIILHDTAGRLDKGNSVSWFQNEKCGVSAHFVVERDGSVVQMVRTDRKAFHAGASKWDGRSGCNSFAIGIEIVNPGKLDEGGNAWFGGAADPDEIEFVDSPEHGGDGYWLPYTAEQITTVKRLCRAIVEEYPDCNEIVGHYHVSPGRKVDPTPLMDFDEVRRFAIEGEDATDETPAHEIASTVQRSERPAPRTMAESTTGNTAIGIGGTGTASMATGISKAAAVVAATKPTDPWWMPVVKILSDAETMTMLVGGFVVISGAIYIWLERAKKLKKHGI